MQRSYSSDPRICITHAGSGRPHAPGQQLTPIPGSDASAPPSPSSPSHNSTTLLPIITNGSYHSPQDKDSHSSQSHLNGSPDNAGSTSRTRTKTSSDVLHRPQQPQSLNAAAEKIATSHSDNGHGSSQKSSTTASTSSSSPNGHKGPTVTIEPSTPTKGKAQRNAPPSPRRPIPAVPNGSLWTGQSTSGPTVAGKGISGPIPNHGKNQLTTIGDLLK